MTSRHDNDHLAVVQTLAMRIRPDAPFTISDEEFAAVQTAVGLMSDLPNAPSMPATKDGAKEAIRAVNSVMWLQLKMLNKIVEKILGEWISLGAEEAEQWARKRVAELDGHWARGAGNSWVDAEIRGIKDDGEAGISPSEIVASQAVLAAASAHRKARNHKDGFYCLMAALPGRILIRDRVRAMHLAGELALSAGLFQEAADVLSGAISEEARQQKAYYRSSALTMRAYAFVELGDWPSAMTDIVQLEDDLEMGWIANVPMLTKEYLRKRAGAIAPDAAP